MPVPGSDARRRAAAKAARERERRAARIRRDGPDPGELEPCPYCGRGVCRPPDCPDDPANDDLSES